MKKVLLVLIFVLNSDFATARSGGIVLDIGPPPLWLGASLASIPIAATPYLFKEGDTVYSYRKTLYYSVISSLAISGIASLITKDSELLLASSTIAPFIGTIIGFNASKTKGASPGRKRFYIGAGIGYSAFFSGHDFIYPMEVGYGITENILIHLNLKLITKTKEDNLDVISILGVSYYMKNNNYIKVEFGDSPILTPYNVKNHISASNKYAEYGSGKISAFYRIISIAYGHSIFKNLTVELNYMNLNFQEFSTPNTDIDPLYNINMFNILLNYRWL